MTQQIHTHQAHVASMRKRCAGGAFIAARFAIFALVMLPALAGAAKVRGATAEDGPWMTAIQSAFIVVDVTTGDLNGDGKEETALCYEIPSWPSHIGVAVLKRERGALRPLFHALFELSCEKVKIAGGRLGIRQEKGMRGPKKLVWKYGTDFVFNHEKGHPLFGTRASASSQLRDGTVALPAAAIDGNIKTSWAEGAAGTGIGETLTLRLPQKIRVAYIGLYGGAGTSARDFYAHNRIHRGSFKTQTPDDLGDEDSGIDFADLGLEIGGDRVEFSSENRPEMHYIRIDKRDVVQLELRIDSVYLGRRHDDTHVAELEVVPLLSWRSLMATTDEAKKSSQSGKEEKASAKTSRRKQKRGGDSIPNLPGNLERGQKAVSDLDKSGRSIVDDVDDF